MADRTETGAQARQVSWRALGWGAAALLLLLPFVAMQFTPEVVWNAEDFIFAGVLIGAVGIMYELALRKSPDRGYRAAVTVALAAAFLTIWANGAVGMIGSTDNPYNLLFGGVILIAFAGAVIARFRSPELSRVMVAAAIATLCVSVGGAFSDLRGGVISMVFSPLWLLAALLFRNAARRNAKG